MTKPIASVAACADAIGRIGAIDRALARIEADKNAAVARAAAGAEEKAAPLAVERQGLAAAVEAFCTANRLCLTNGGTTKTATFPTGAVAWRKGRDTVAVDEAEKDRILARLKTLGARFRRFIKVTESVSKTAIAAATDKERTELGRIRGIAFIAGVEAFTITPLELPLVGPGAES